MARFARACAAIVIALGWGAPREALAEDARDRPPEEKPEHFFYRGRDYGNESLYGPIWVFLNRAYDVLQLRPGQRNVLDQSYGRDGKVVLRNLGNPFPAIAADGWGRFLRTEIFPLSYTSNSAYWVPNYALHLIGGGMTYRALGEWFEDRGVPVPRVWSGATLLAAALVNETLENRGNRRYNTDAIADVYFFDIGGMLLFSSDAVARFFSHEVVVSDWSLQPSFTFPGGNLQNQANDFAVRWWLPFHRRLAPFVHMGLGWLFGLSYRVAGEYSVSAAAGERSYRLTNVALNSLQNRVNFAPSGALFIDRNGSLLAALEVRNIEESFLQLNVFPNALMHSNPGIGFWYMVGKNGQFLTGLTMTHAFEFGLGYERPVPR